MKMYFSYGNMMMNNIKRMGSSGPLRCVALVRTDVSEELSASVVWVTKIGEPATTLALTSNRPNLFCISSQRVSVAS
jgi:hypothetical protein